MVVTNNPAALKEMEEVEEMEDSETEAADSREQVLNTDVFDFNLMDRGISIEDLQQEQIDTYDPNKDWKDQNQPKTAKATVGVAVSEAWEQAKAEFTHIRSKLQNKLGSERPSFDAIFDLVFGFESDIFKVFQRSPHTIFVSHDEFQQFLATFFLSASWFDSRSRVLRYKMVAELIMVSVVECRPKEVLMVRQE